jgi:stearoyl-CoA desaturase (delta-9 desaturase)
MGDGQQCCHIIDMEWKIKTLIILNHIAAIYGLLYGDLVFLLLSCIGLLLINKIGGEIGLHRYFCHRSFKTSRLGHYALLTLACLNCFGPPVAWVGVHRKHHAFADTNQDPHGAQSKWRIWFTVWKPFTIEKRYVSDLLKDRDQRFVYKWYFWLIAALWASLFLINWQLPIFLLSIPSVISFHQAGLVNTMCHDHGDKDYDTKDNSFNNRWVNMITMGSGLHNTHHAYPTRWDNRDKPGDIDIPALIIKHVFIVKTQGSSV